MKNMIALVTMLLSACASANSDDVGEPRSDDMQVWEGEPQDVVYVAPEPTPVAKIVVQPAPTDPVLRLEATPVQTVKEQDAGPPAIVDEKPSEVTLPNITFSIVGEDSYNARFPLPYLHEALTSALLRWSTATCRTLEMVPEGGQHTVKWGDATTIVPGRLGQTTGSWDAALIQSKKITKGATPIILAHELAHLLARSNDHAVDGVYSDDPFSEGNDVITEADLTKVCSSFECKCFIPEK